MGRITAIFTGHTEIGRCNSSELLNIIEKIKQLIFFEELSLSNFERSYFQNDLETLETNTLKRYRVGKEINQYPVDTFPRTRKHDECVGLLYSRITGSITKEAFNFRQLIDHPDEMTKVHGFNFLNSTFNDQILSNLDSLKTTVFQPLPG